MKNYFKSLTFIWQLVLIFKVTSTTSKILYDGDASLNLDTLFINNCKNDNPDSIYSTFDSVNNGSSGKVWRFLKPTGDHRCEGHCRYQAKTEGDEIYIGWKSKVTVSPKDLKLNAIFQWKAYGTPMLQNYPITVNVGGESLLLSHFDEHNPHIQTKLIDQPFQPDHWYSFVLHLKTSFKPTDGFIEFWIDGVQQTFLTGSKRFVCRTLDATNVDPKFGIYGGDGGDVTNYVGGIKVATTFAEASP